ncbi:AbrB/MazE/SpoVT family DNA-binding domain-containing protein [Candidatus Wolfebacteria bacterium]|nr:AbrB/MazE/SpoVT family DNA-binding domain-containing protein [Candidatus Wolfebacteria bacterium]
MEMNTVVTIPKKLAVRGDLVVIPRQDYEEFFRWKKNVRVRFDERWFWTPEWQKKEAEADMATRAGKVHGPFSDYRKLLAELKKK